MTIKSKLIANTLVTLAIIVFISLAAFSSMSFLQEKFAYLAEKSAPLQLRTMESQNELQRCISSLIKVNSARTIPEYTAFRSEAENSLERVRNARNSLEKISGSAPRGEASNDLSQIAEELFSASEARIKSDLSASEAHAKITQLMKRSAASLKVLEMHARNLQVTRSGLFAAALADTTRFSTRLRALEELRNLVKDLLSVSAAAHDAQTKTSFLIAKGKIKVLLGRIAGNRAAAPSATDIKVVRDDTNKFLQLQADAVIQKNDESGKWAGRAFNELKETLNRLHLSLKQDIELASARLDIETKNQGAIFAESQGANDILQTNSELVALTLTVTGEINSLFALGSPAEFDAVDANIRSLFTSINEHSGGLEHSLAALDAGDEMKMLQVAAASLAAIRSELYSDNGIVPTLQNRLRAIEQTDRSGDKLHAIVARQSAQGKESVLNAQAEQEKSTAAVNGMIQRSLSQASLFVTVAFTLSMLLGLLIYRSVVKPLGAMLSIVRSHERQVKEKAEVAKAIAGGNLDVVIPIGSPLSPAPLDIREDEVGTVLKAITEMSDAQATLDRAFAGMTTSLRTTRDQDARRDRLNSGLYELNKILRGEHTTAELADETLTFIADFLGAGVGIIYLYDAESEMLQTLSTYAIPRSKQLNWGFLLGEGLPGQVALERKMICLHSTPHDYLSITSALGKADPLNVTIMPIMHNDTLAGVLELGSFKLFSDDDFEFLTQSMEGIAIAININRSRQTVNDLLERTQAQAEELKVQQEELQQSNEELEGGARLIGDLTLHDR
ncbi:MAG: GAF domain-containing protein [Desulfuromonadaceae bacterium]|nr:GAF domain-containing protein [Desulfuromonadaceae bacterium]